MAEQETLLPESEEMKNEYEININDNKLRIEINNDEIIFILMIEISFYKYIKKYQYNELIKKLGIKDSNNI